jgi:hypothetical protein
LSQVTDDMSAEMVLDAAFRNIERFVAGAEASDDLTMMVVRWRGDSARGE